MNRFLTHNIQAYDLRMQCFTCNSAKNCIYYVQTVRENCSLTIQAIQSHSASLLHNGKDIHGDYMDLFYETIILKNRLESMFLRIL